jgi:glycosyltransferase involved in cell wall biosynthesis
VGKPIVRILMPVYNGEKFIRQAIESVKAQTFTDWELYIVDDGSTDNSAGVVKEYCSERIILIQQNNQGDEAARVKAAEGAETKYLARLDADDIMLPYRLEKQVSHMDKKHDIGLLGGQIAYVSEDGKKYGFRSWWPCAHEEIMNLLLSSKGSICNSTLMVRCEFHNKLNWPGPGLPGRDVGYALELSRLCKIENLPEVISLVRIHKDSIQSRKDPTRRVLLEEFYHDRYFREEKGLPLVDWKEFEKYEKKKNTITKILDWRELMISRTMRKGVWLWLNRESKILFWPWFILAGLIAPDRYLARLTRILKGKTNATR